MKVRWYHAAILILAILLLITAAALIGRAPADRDVLYQVSAMSLLVNGSYDGIVTAGDLKHNGDIGLGTFEGLNGEMVVLDGTVYQVTSDGMVHIVNDSTMVPFAAVTYFDPDTSIRFEGQNNLSTLTVALDNKLPSKNVFYAIRIHATFPYLKVRSVPAQNKPYPPLADVVKNQSVFELKNVTGTIVGIYSPQYTNGIESPGYHFHFITDDHTSGGHVLDLTSDGLELQLDATPRFNMLLA